MWMFSLAWRNLWRHRRRTFITATAMAVAVGLCMAMIAWTDGIYGEISRILVDNQLGHVQVHHPDYPSQKVMYQTIHDADARVQALEALPSTRGATARLFGFGLIGGERKSAGGQMIGIDPARERTVSQLHEQMIEGSFLADEPGRTVIMGVGLANTLKLGLGDEVVAVTQSADGSMGNELYAIVGLYRTGSQMKDRSSLYMHLDDLQTLLVLDDQVHEITLQTRSNTQEVVLDYREQAAAALGGNSEAIHVQTWWEVAPQAMEMLALQDVSVGIILGIVFMVAAFGVINTMLMSVFERTVELGVLKAIGLRPRQMVGLIVVESILLAALSSVIGLLIGGVLDYYLIVHGLDFSDAIPEDGFSFMGVTLNPVMHGAFYPYSVVLPVVSVFVVSILASLWPAIRASRLSPVDAIRTE